MASSLDRTRLAPSVQLPSRFAMFCLLLACLASTVHAQAETLNLADHSIAGFHAPAPTAASQNRELRKRADRRADKEEIKNDDNMAMTTMTLSIVKATETAAVSQSPLPEAFDGDWKGDLKSSSGSNCPAFLDSIFNDPSYEQCYPLSLMMETSRDFWKAQKQLLSIVRVLDATCNANVTYCTDFFSAATKNLTQTKNCGSEVDNGDRAATQVLQGMKAYQMIYQATCLQNPSDDMYCYANAVANTSASSNAYFYTLPFNLSLPASTSPSCDWCIQETMSIFHAATSDRSQLVTATYESAARQVNAICGIDFVNGTLSEAKAASPGSITLPSWPSMIVAVLGGLAVNALL